MDLSESKLPIGMTGFLAGLTAGQIANHKEEDFGLQKAIKEVQEELDPTDTELSFALFSQIICFGTQKPIKERLVDSINCLREGRETLSKMSKEEIDELINKNK